jgi:putative heme-binding domain-containing protein
MKLVAVAFLVLCCACQRSRDRELPRFTAPPGFTIETAAPGSLVGSLVAFTFDSLGRPVVAKERKHPTLLADKDGDGIFETEKIFSTKVNSLQGLWFDGRTLYAVGNNEEGRSGLYKLTDTNGDDEADAFEQLSTFERGMGEHGPHDIRRAPDGIPTIMLGNHTGVPPDRMDHASPLRGYREWQLLERYMDARGHAAGIMAPGGTVVRWNEDRRNFTVLFGGFRNAYSHAYNLDGEAFTFDSDMEWDINMPWYREVRSVHGVPGGDYGWRTGSGKFPAYYFDSLPPVRDVGRGSPVGVEFYQHHVYPREYFDAYLEGDWSRGRILISNLVRRGATYAPASATAKEFVHGEPLNVTDLETGPDGFVYFSTGGRDTEGGFYRIRYRPGFWSRLFRDAEPEGVLALTRQPQPLSSWGHAALEKAKESMGPRWGEELEQLAGDTTAESRDRIQAVHLLQRFGPKPRAELLRRLATDRDAMIRAAAIYVAGQHGSARAKAIAADALKDRDPFVRRRAAEAIVRMGLSPDQPSFVPLEDVYALLKDADRFVRYAGRLVLERISRAEWTAKVLSEADPAAAMEGMLALIRTKAGDEQLEPVFERTMSLLGRTGLSIEQRLNALRLFSVAAAETKDGVRASVRKQVSDIVLRQFPDPGNNEPLNREMARVLAYCGQPESIQMILDAMPKQDSNQPLQIHYAYCLRSIKQGWTADQKTVLSRWFVKAAKWRGGASFTGFINLIFDSSLEFFTDEEKKLAYARLPEFAPAEDYKAAMAKRMKETGWGAPSVLSRSKGVQAVSAQEIFEFQMFDPMITMAKPERGAELFEKECASCHRFGGSGNDFGPDLTTLRRRFKKKDVLESILWPSKAISDQYESTIVETKDGDIINGLLVKEDAQKLLLKTAEVQRPIEVPKSRVRARRKSKISIMPEGMLDGYDQGAIASLIAYLQAPVKK